MFVSVCLSVLMTGQLTVPEATDVVVTPCPSTTPPRLLQRGAPGWRHFAFALHPLLLFHHNPPRSPTTQTFCPRLELAKGFPDV